jgi:hypothetical protein
MESYPPHWSYYVSLEDDFIETSRYVEFCDENFKTYSTQFARLILAVGSEVDVIAKELCSKAKPKNKPMNINQYKQILVPAFPAIMDVVVGIQWNPMRLHAWKSWKQSKRPNPGWWTAYNSVKHGRIKNEKLASLGNAINALAGLYVLMIHLDKPAGYQRPSRYLRVEST